MGAGAVGSLLGAQLQAAGHEVQFWVRPERRAPRVQRTLQRVNGPALQLEAAFLGPGDAVPDCDWVFVCVRGEQLDTALQQVAAQLGAAGDLAISAVSDENVLVRARRHGLTGTVLAHGVSFGAWRDPAEPARFFWFPFALPNVLSAEGERASLPRARELARALSLAGSPTRALGSARAFSSWMVALSGPFIAGWDLCGFALERLAREPATRRLTARAMAEAIAAQPRSGIMTLARWVPIWAYALLLRALPYVIGRSGREVWLHHGPKIRDQTRYSLQLAQRSAAQSGSPAPALDALAQRFERERPLR